MPHNSRHSPPASDCNSLALSDVIKVNKTKGCHSDRAEEDIAWARKRNLLPYAYSFRLDAEGF